MIICSVQNASKNYGGNQLFEDITFEINDGERIGIVGTNGSGKTTILKLIAKVEHLDNGAIHLKKGLRIGYLAQIPSFDKGMKVEEVLGKAFENLHQLEKRMKVLETKMVEEVAEEKRNKLLVEYGMIQEEFLRLGRYEIDSEITKIANGLGISDLLKQDFNLLSGGEQTKVGLGMMLLTKPDLLLLDEPTNHLDIYAVEWLEKFLKQYDGTIISVSHDRYFLNK